MIPLTFLTPVLLKRGTHLLPPLEKRFYLVSLCLFLLIPVSSDAAALTQDIDMQLNQAVQLQHTGNLQQAIDEYHSILQGVASLSVDNLALFNLGLCYYNLSMFDKAVEIFRQIDMPFESHLFSGLSLLRNGSSTTGLTEIKQAIEADPYRSYQFLRTYSVYDETGTNLLVYVLRVLMDRGQHRDAYLICCHLKNGNNIPELSGIMEESRKKLKGTKGRQLKAVSSSQDIPVVRVGIGTDKQGNPVYRKSIRFRSSSSFELSGKNSRNKWSGMANEWFEVLQLPDGLIQCQKHGTFIAEDREGIIISPIDETAVITLDNIPYGVGYLWEGQRQCGYRGRIEVCQPSAARGTTSYSLQPTALSGLSIVNVVNLEEYLYGVVPSEIESDVPFECLKAQSVASRSEALHRLERNRHKGREYFLCDSQHCQVYSGIQDENEKVQTAIDITRGEVLMSGTVTCDAVFHACCGGHTQDSSELGWGEVAYLKGVSDLEGTRTQRQDNPPLLLRSCPLPRGDVPPLPLSRGEGTGTGVCPLTPAQLDMYLKLPHDPGTQSFCKAGSSFRWITYISKKQLGERINKRYPVGEILQIIPLKRAASGHIFSIKVKGTTQEMVIKREDEIREIFGRDVLYSSLFVIEPGFDRNGRGLEGFIIFGGGFGHGVGMCQTGAAGMADKGYLYDEILRHYYAGSGIKKRW